MPTPPEPLDVPNPDITSLPSNLLSSPPTVLKWMVGMAIAIFLLCSSLRHQMFQSTGYDLGIYDQVIYLISQGKPPISSILGFHHLGNHGAWAVYPLGLLYKIYPSVYWLLIVQAIALSMGGWCTWGLARLEGLNKRLSVTMAGVYLLYPVVFNINFFDFHPEVMALPALLAAILAAKLRQSLWFCVAILWVLGCKAVLSLTVLALGFWLLLFEKRRSYGLIAIALGMAWFILVTQWMIPDFSGREVEGVWRYSYLGTSVIEILQNLILKPHLVLGRLISGSTIDYLFKLALPVIGWLSPSAWISMIPALPTLVINSLSEVPFQRSLAYQYSIPVIPFLLLTMINSLKSGQWMLAFFIGKLWQKIPHLSSPTASSSLASSPGKAKSIILWSLLIFLLYGKYARFGLYFQRLDTWQATRQAIMQVQPQTPVLTDNRLAPHFSHRQVIQLLSQISLDSDLSEFDQIVLNLRHPWPDTAEIADQLSQKLAIDPQFSIIYQQDDVVVFNRNYAANSQPPTLNE